MEGQLEVTVHSCRGLDSGGFKLNSFVKFKYGGKNYKTFVKVNSTDPEWEDSFKFDFNSNEQADLRLQLFRVLVGDAKTLIGAVRIKLDSLEPCKKAKAWYKLSGSGAKLKVSLKYTPADRVVRSRAAEPEDWMSALFADEDGASDECDDDDPAVKTLKHQFPHSSTDDIKAALDSSGGNTMAAGARLLTEKLKMGAMSLIKKSQMSQVKFQAAAETEDVEVEACDGASDSDEEEVDSSMKNKMNQIRTMFPHLNLGRVKSALKACGWEEAAAMDTLLDDQLATIAMTSTAQTMAATAKHPSRSADADEEEELDVDSSLASISAKDFGLMSAAHVGRVDDSIPPTGRRKALLIGINYFGTKQELRGCVSDVQRMRKMITTVYGFPDDPNYLTVLCDDNPDKRFHPTRRNILAAIQWLVKGAKRGDVRFFHFSGHGSQLRDETGDEENGFDETILPVDYKEKGQIRDDELNATLVEPLPEGVKITCVMDCCHSGTGLDLPYMLDRSGGKWDRESNPKYSESCVQMFSGCQDEETSADVMVPSFGAGGAMSIALLASLTSNPYGYTYQGLMNNVHDLMRSRGFTQQPQLSSTQPLDMSHKFSMVDGIVPNLNATIGREHKKEKKKSKKSRGRRGRSDSDSD